jgi:hypothetical protein
MKLVFHSDVEGLNVDITINAKEVHPYVMGGEGSQLLVAFTNHDYSDHQTSKGTINNDFLCDTIIPMSQLFVQQCMHYSQLHIVAQLVGVFTQVVRY